MMTSPVVPRVVLLLYNTRLVRALSTVGSWLRSFAWYGVRQLDRVTRELLARAWAAGFGPG